MLFKYSFAVALLLTRDALAQQAECDSYGYGPDVLTKELGVEMPQICFDNDTGGQKRCFHTYVPPCAAETPSPALMILHGSESCPVVNAKENGWIEKAQEECFVAVFPMGRMVELSEYDLFMNCWEVPGGLNLPPASVPDGPETNSCCCSHDFEEVPGNLDLEFLYQVVESVVSTEMIDKKRIYVSGHSNGCILAHAFHRTYSDIVAAMSCTAAPAINPVPGSYIPTPQLSIRGEMDAVVYFDGYLEEGLLKDHLIFPSAEASFQESLAANGCSGEIDPIVVPVPEMDVWGIPATMEHRKGDGCTAETELVILSSAGHAIVNDAKEDDPGAANTSVDITSLMWDFLSRFESAEMPNFGSSEPAAPDASGESDPDKTSEVGDASEPESTEPESTASEAGESGGVLLGGTCTMLAFSIVVALLAPSL